MKTRTEFRTHASRLVGAALLLSALSVAGAAQQPVQRAAPSGAGCALQFHDHYVCNREAFQARLGTSLTVQVSVARMDLFAAQEMKKLVQSVGKTEVSPGGKPDLIFELSAIDRSGRIEVGPGDFALATLTVYEPVRGTDGRRRIWVETYDGQEDRPWPGTVVDLIHQFNRNALGH